MPKARPLPLPAPGNITPSMHSTCSSDHVPGAERCAECCGHKLTQATGDVGWQGRPAALCRADVDHPHVKRRQHIAGNSKNHARRHGMPSFNGS